MLFTIHRKHEGGRLPSGYPASVYADKRVLLAIVAETPQEASARIFAEFKPRDGEPICQCSQDVNELGVAGFVTCQTGEFVIRKTHAKNPRGGKYLFSFYYPGMRDIDKAAIIADTPEEAVAPFRATFVPKFPVSHGSELEREVGTAVFGPHLFRPMTPTEQDLAGLFWGRICYDGPIGLIGSEGKSVELSVAQAPLLQ